MFTSHCNRQVTDTSPTGHRQSADRFFRELFFTITSFSAGGISGFLSAGGVAAAFTGIGFPAAVPIGCVASLFGITAAGLTGFYKKLEPKLIKHCKIMTLALSKCDTVNRILSKSLIDGKISDAEFQSILDEKESY